MNQLIPILHVPTREAKVKALEALFSEGRNQGGGWGLIQFVHSVKGGAYDDYPYVMSNMGRVVCFIDAEDASASFYTKVNSPRHLLACLRALHPL